MWNGSYNEKKKAKSHETKGQDAQHIILVVIIIIIIEIINGKFLIRKKEIAVVLTN